MHAYIPGKILGGIQVFVAYHEDSGDLLIHYKEQSNSDFLHQKKPFVWPSYQGNTDEQSKALQRTSY